MAQILIRKFGESAKAELQLLAKRNGRSMEAEARDILYDGLLARRKPEVGFGTATHELFKNCGLDEPIHEWRGFPVEPIKFGE